MASLGGMDHLATQEEHVGRMEFEGLCCLNLSLRSGDVHATLRKMNEMISNIKQKSQYWLINIFQSGG